MKKLVWFALLLAAGCASSPATRDIKAVGGFDIRRYAGKWHEIARLPHPFEKDMADVTAEYSLRPDGAVEVRNTGIKNGRTKTATAIARFKGPSDIGELRVSFFRPFYGDYRVIRLEPDYSSAIVTSSTRDYLWILSREPEMPASLLADYLGEISAWGFRTNDLIYPGRAPADGVPRAGSGTVF